MFSLLFQIWKSNLERIWNEFGTNLELQAIWLDNVSTEDKQFLGARMTRKFVKRSKFFSFGVMSLTPLGLMDLFLTISIQNSEELGREDRSSRCRGMRSDQRKRKVLRKA